MTIESMLKSGIRIYRLKNKKDDDKMQREIMKLNKQKFSVDPYKILKMNNEEIIIIAIVTKVPKGLVPTDFAEMGY